MHPRCELTQPCVRSAHDLPRQGPARDPYSEPFSGTDDGVYLMFQQAVYGAGSATPFTRAWGCAAQPIKCERRGAA